MTYTLSRAERWKRAGIIGATLLVWLGAVWLLAVTLGISYANLRSTLVAARSTWTNGTVLQGWLITIVLLGAPVLIWHMLTEATVSFVIDIDELNITTLGIPRTYLWDQLVALVALRDNTSADLGLLMRTTQAAAAPAYRRIPLPNGIAERDHLIQQLRERITTNSATTPA